MDDKEKKQSFDEEFAPEISPGYRQDVHKPPKYKNTSFLMGITIFAAVLLILIIFVYFWWKVAYYMKKQDSNRSKRTIKTQKGYAGDSVHTLKQVEQGNLYIAQKELGQQNENL